MSRFQETRSIYGLIYEKHETVVKKNLRGSSKFQDFKKYDQFTNWFMKNMKKRRETYWNIEISHKHTNFHTFRSFCPKDPGKTSKISPFELPNTQESHVCTHFKEKLPLFLAFQNFEFQQKMQRTEMPEDPENRRFSSFSRMSGREGTFFGSSLSPFPSFQLSPLLPLFPSPLFPFFPPLFSPSFPLSPLFPSPSSPFFWFPIFSPLTFFVSPSPLFSPLPISPLFPSPHLPSFPSPHLKYLLQLFVTIMGMYHFAPSLYLTWNIEA